MNAGLTAECVHDQPGIVGKGGTACGFRRGYRLDARIGGKSFSGFVRLGQTKLAGRLRLDAIGREQVAHLGKLSRIMGGDHHRTGELPAHVTANFCKSTSLPMPLRASASSTRN